MPNRYSREEIARVIDANSLEDYLVETGVELKRSGAGFITKCPFHDEKDPSLYVHPQKQFWHCYGCHKGGNVLDFHMEYNGTGFLESLEYLAQRGGITLLRHDSPEWKEHKRKEDLLTAAEYYFRTKIRESVPSSYLAKRGVSSEVQDAWMLGYAGAWGSSLFDFLRGQGYNEREIEGQGLAKMGRDRNYYDIFCDRLMIPITDHTGKMVGFIGRDLSGREDVPKYKNSSGEVNGRKTLFQKDHLLFGLSQAARAIKEARFVYVTEGNFDVITAHTSGFKNFVAPQGTAFTSYHAELLAKYCDSIIFVFDNDKAGVDSALRSAKVAYAVGLDPEFILLPKPAGTKKVDLDEYLRRSSSAPQEFSQLPRLDIVKYFLQAKSDQLDLTTPRGKGRALEEIIDCFKGESNYSRKIIWVQYAAEQLGIDPRAVEERYFEKLDDHRLDHVSIVIPPTITEAAWCYLANLMLLPPSEAKIAANGISPESSIFEQEQRRLYDIILKRSDDRESEQLVLRPVVPESSTSSVAAAKTVFSFLSELHHSGRIPHIPYTLVRLAKSKFLPSGISHCKNVLLSYIRVEEQDKILRDMVTTKDETRLGELSVRLDRLMI